METENPEHEEEDGEALMYGSEYYELENRVPELLGEGEA